MNIDELLTSLSLVFCEDNHIIPKSIETEEIDVNHFNTIIKTELTLEKPTELFIHIEVEN